MKTKTALWLFFVMGAAALLWGFAFGHRLPASPNVAPAASVSERTFEVTGRVVAVHPGEKTIRIAHDEIPEYMPAMTMPFTVRKSSVLDGVAAGDAVQFQLVVTEDDSWISRIHKSGTDVKSARSPGNALSPTGSAPELDRVQVGESVPDFALVNQDGQTVRLSGFAGKAVILTFIYTRCPLPNFCPLMSKNFASLQARLGKDLKGRFQLLSVSIDPEFDRPEILKSYALRYEADDSLWTFGTGTREQIDGVASLFGLTHEPENGFIAHDLRTALISPDGKLVHLWKSNVWTPYEVDRRVREILAGSEPSLARSE